MSSYRNMLERSSQPRSSQNGLEKKPTVSMIPAGMALPGALSLKKKSKATIPQAKMRVGVPKRDEQLKVSSQLVETIQEKGGNFHFNLYAESATIDPRSEKIIFTNLYPGALVFETKTKNRPIKDNYITKLAKTPDLLNSWDLFFGPSGKPNSLIEGFDQGEKRKVLFLTLSNPQVEGNRTSFNYHLDKIDDTLDLANNLPEWKENEELQHLSILID